MRIVTRVYVDGQTKPHYDEYKLDCDDESSLTQVGEDIEQFITDSFWGIREEEDNDR